MASSVIYIHLRNFITFISFASPHILIHNLQKYLLNSTFIALFRMRRLLSWLQKWLISIDDIFSNARCSMVVAIFSCLLIPGDSFLVLNNGRLCKVFPMLVQAFLMLSPSLLVWSYVEQGLLCWVFWALLSCCNIRSSFAGIWPFSETLLPSLRPGNPSWPSVDCHCCLLEKILFSKKFSSHAGDSYLDWYHFFSAIGESKWRLFGWGSSGGSVGLQDIW